MSDYRTFLESKVRFTEESGFDVAPGELNPALKPLTHDLVRWALKGGRRAIFAAFGLHKTVTQLEIARLIGTRLPTAYRLIVVPLGVRHEFTTQAAEYFRGPHAVRVKFIRTAAELEGPDTIYLTNFESVRDGKLDPNLFACAMLDEASVLRSFGSKTYQTFLTLFDRVTYRFVATATPSPNRYKELIHYAAFLGIMDSGQALTRFFQRDSTQANTLTLYPHMEAEFFAWLHSWAIFVQSPADLGHDDTGYVLPPFAVHYHEVATPAPVGKFDRDGQAQLIADAALSLKDAADEKRVSIPRRLAQLRAILTAHFAGFTATAAEPVRQCLVWCELNAEQEAVEALCAELGLTVSSIFGALDDDEQEARLTAFQRGETQVLIGKPVMLGSGVNLQRHCYTAVFVGITYKFNDFIQAIHRVHRFGQSHPVVVHVIHTEAEREVLKALQAKWAEDGELRRTMQALIRAHGLNATGLARELTRSIGCARRAATGALFEVVNADSVEEYARIDADRFGMLLTSIPFGNHYEYSPSYNDFGHNPDNDGFWRQMDYLTPELLRTLMPGRILAVHVKDRIRFGNVTGDGFPTSDPFHAEAIFHYRRHGFRYVGMITVVTDVVRENNQTYRLSYTQQCKDGTKMGVGSPEYVLLFRKLPSDTSDGYADVPVAKAKAEYPLSRWQVDAHAFWRSSGNRLLTADELAELGPDVLASLFREQSRAAVYDYADHLRVGQALAEKGRLPTTFMALAPGSHHPDVWDDVVRMRTLNGQQTQRGLTNHICLVRGSLVLTRERGYVPIQDVRVGEHALTHRGRWRPVLAVQNTGVRRVVRVEAQGVPGLVLTPDHKLWMRTSSWKRQRDGAARAEPGWVPADESLGGYVNLKLPDVEDGHAEDTSLWWLVGRWLADGHWDARGSAVLSCGAHEVEDVVRGLGARAGGVHDTGTAFQIRLLDRRGDLRAILARCGEGASGKHLPAEAIALPREAAAALLAGYLSGDGHFLRARDRWIASSVSKALALGVAALFQRVHGVVASVYPGRGDRAAVIQRRTVQCRQEWIVTADLPTARRKQPFVLDDGAWKKVRRVVDAGEAETWNIRVAEDESFTAEGCVVKNCPLQLDIVDRLIERFTNPGDEVSDPFGGLFTVPYCAIRLGRRGHACELNPAYFDDGLRYVRAAEDQITAPTLFDALAAVEEPAS